MPKRIPVVRQKYRVRYFVARTYDIEVEAHSADNARLQAKIKLHEGRGKGFKRGGEMWVIESWADLAASADDDAGMTHVGNLDHPLFILPPPVKVRHSAP